MADYNITEIADARYMGLMCPPASPEAKALVADIINIIEQSEQRQRARKAKDNRFQRLLISFNTDSCCSFTIAFKSIVVEASRSTFAFSVMPSAKSVSK